MNNMGWIVILNAVNLICWTIIACVFNHWWLALFSLIFTWSTT